MNDLLLFSALAILSEGKCLSLPEYLHINKLSVKIGWSQHQGINFQWWAVKFFRLNLET